MIFKQVTESSGRDIEVTKNKNLEESTKLNVEQLAKNTEENIPSTLQRKNKENSKNL